MIITPDCQKYHALCLKSFSLFSPCPSFSSRSQYSVSVADHDQDRRTEDGGWRMEDGGLENWRIGLGAMRRRTPNADRRTPARLP